MDYYKKLQEEVKIHTKEKENKEAKALAKQKAKATPKAFHDDSDDEPCAKSGCMYPCDSGSGLASMTFRPAWLYVGSEGH